MEQPRNGSTRERTIQRAREHIRYGLDLAGRQAVYSARQEFAEALRLIATESDLAEGIHEHEPAVAAGLRALDSIDLDHAKRNGALAETQPTPDRSPSRDASIGGNPAAGQLSGVSAVQRQLLRAQEQLAFGVGHEPTASMALYLLGRSQTAVVDETAEERALAGPKTMALYQAALAVDPANYLAANELGTLLANYGQLEEAQRVLTQGVSIAPQPAMWHNLSVVCERMGNTVAAQQARAQGDALVAERRAKGESIEPSQVRTVAASVRWADPAEFARCSGSDDMDGPPVQRNASAPPQQTAPVKPLPARDAELSMPDRITSALKNLGGKRAAGQYQ